MVQIYKTSIVKTTISGLLYYKITLKIVTSGSLNNKITLKIITTPQIIYNKIKTKIIEGFSKGYLL